MNAVASLRRYAVIAMVVAIVTGLISTVLLFVVRNGNPIWLAVSVAAFAIGWLLDKRASAIELRKPD
ncbi:MAG: hypothetical protein RL490_563 [Pseudomonadota bacterium]|jgi:predicted PurR-regulated permease PerM